MLIDRLKAQLAALKRFGASSEKLDRAIEQLQDGEATLAEDVTHEETPYLRLRGRRRTYDREAFDIHHVVKANTPDGLPEVQADTEEMMADWCRDTWGPDSIPSETTIRERVRKVYTALRARGKP